MKGILRFAIVALAFCAAMGASAWDGSVQGVIGRIDVAEAENFGFRVYLEGAPVMCAQSDGSNGDNWAYINGSDSNYDVYVSTLLSAKATGDTVRIYTNADLGNSRCRIGYVSYY